MTVYQPHRAERVAGPKPVIYLRPDLAAYFIPARKPACAKHEPKCQVGVLAQLAEGGSWE